MLRVRGYHPLRLRFPTDSARYSPRLLALLQPRLCRNTDGLGFSPFARHYWGNHSYFLLLQVLRCFSSLRSPPDFRMIFLQNIGLSHSDIRGSKDICSSPRLFAAYHVLHRLREPRHPPFALLYFRLNGPIARTCLFLVFLVSSVQYVIELCLLKARGE